MTAKIEGGYYIKARKIQDSKIANMSPCTREVWDYLIKSCNYEQAKTSGRTINRGQCFRSIPEIRNDLFWYVGFNKKWYTRRSCEGAIERLRKEGMIVTMNEGRGLLITVCNYAYYQDPKNYERDDEGNDEGVNTVEIRGRGGESKSKKKKNIIIEEEKRKSAKSVDLPAEFDEMILEFRSHFKNKFTGYRTKLESERIAVESLRKRKHTDLNEYYEILKFLQSDDFWCGQCRYLGKLLILTKDKTQYEFDRLLSKAREPNQSGYKQTGHIQTAHVPDHKKEDWG